jgi:hypothetical protein
MYRIMVRALYFMVVASYFNTTNACIFTVIFVSYLSSVFPPKATKNLKI